MKKTLLLTGLFTAMLGVDIMAQRPGQPPRPRGPEARQPGGWVRPIDMNGNGSVEAEEFQSALDRTFAELDRNGNKTIDAGESRRPGPPPPPPNQAGPRPGDGGKRLLPPFFFSDVADPSGTYSRQEFEKIARKVFAEMDSNGDGVINGPETQRLPPRPNGPDQPPMRPEAPNARFIGAEARFGDRLVKGAPFSADTLIVDTKRLFDGTTVSKERRGAFYRDGEGRTRREQPLEFVAGVSVVGTDNKPQMLIFINDFAAQQQVFLDVNNKIARKTPLGPGTGPIETRPGAEEESLGSKTIEGITVEGTRVSFEIPAGRFGNDKAMKSYTERWFSKELQVAVMIRNMDPLAGEHVFKLVNIKRGEPNSELFNVPAGYKIETPSKRQ
jgi:EF hand